MKQKLLCKYLIVKALILLRYFLLFIVLQSISEIIPNFAVSNRE